MQFYSTYYGQDGEECEEYYSDVCNGIEHYDDHSLYVNTYTEGEVEGTYIYEDSYENCDGSVYDFYE